MHGIPETVIGYPLDEKKNLWKTSAIFLREMKGEDIEEDRKDGYPN